MVQWLRRHTTITEGAGSIPDQGTKIQHATWCSQINTIKENPDFKQVQDFSNESYKMCYRFLKNSASPSK